MIKRYTQVSEMSVEVQIFCVEAAVEINQLYGSKFNWHNINLDEMLVECRFTVCFKDNKPVGFMIARLYPSIFDPKTIILMQDLLYGKKGTKAASLLFKDFIDFGKANAKHIITMIGKNTNIKARTLRRLGFSELEVLYRMET